MKKHLGKKILASVMAGAMLFGTVAAGTMAFAADATSLKVAAFSDINYKEGQADAEGMFLARSRPALDTAISVIAGTDAEVVLITGNLTYDGSQESHNYVAGKLATLVDMGKKVYVVPGENDVAESGVNTGAITKAQFKTTYANFGYAAPAAADTETISYVAAPKAGFKVMMLDSVAAPTEGSASSVGQGAINVTWAKNNVELAVAGGDKVIAASHHPSVTRGSAETTLIGLVWEVAKAQDASGATIYTGDPFEGLDIVDKSAFSYADMQTLYAAGLTDIFTGHALMNNVMTETVTTEVTDEATGDVTPVTTDTWTDYNCGSLVSAGCGVRFATVTASETTSTFTDFSTVDGLNVQNKLAYDALRAYAFTYVDEVVAMAKPVIYKVLDIAEVIGKNFAGTIKLGGIAGVILDGTIQNAVRDLIGRVMNDLRATNADGTKKLDVALDDIVAGLKNTSVPTSDTTTVSMLHALTDMMRQRQRNNQLVCESFEPMVNQLKAATPGEDHHYPASQTPLAQKLVQNFAAVVNATNFMDLLNTVLSEQLKLGVANPSIRELLYAPYTVLGQTIDLWSIMDGLITPAPPAWALPSALYKDLVKDILIGAGGSAQTAAALKSKISGHAADLVDRFLIIGGAYAI